MPTVRLSSSLIILVFAAAACHTRPPATVASLAPAPSAAPAPAPTRPPAPPPPAPLPPRVVRPAEPLSEAELFRRKSLDELNTERPLHDAFFDYDQSALREDARQALQMDAQWLAKWPQTKVRVDGHCDERGTPEYNLALGDRRAEVVKDYLASLGVRPDRIQTRSLGRDAPFCVGSSEECWSQNRRDHFLVTEK
ncbi:MAG: peptidoglycan-associated lipoprotein Pal [Acidobacteriota bacterium]